MNPIESLILLIGLLLSCVFLFSILGIHFQIVSNSLSNEKNTKIETKVITEPQDTSFQFDKQFRWFILFFIAILMQVWIAELNSDKKFAALVIESLPNAILNFTVFFLFAFLFLEKRNLWFLIFVYSCFYFINELLIPKVFNYNDELNLSNILVLRYYVGIIIPLLAGYIFYSKDIRLDEVVSKPIISINELFLFILGVLSISFSSYFLSQISITDFFESITLGILSGIFSSLVFLMVYYLWGQSLYKEVGILTCFASGYTITQFQSVATPFAALFLLLLSLSILFTFIFYFLVRKSLSPLWVLLIIFPLAGLLSYLLQPWIELRSLTNYDGMNSFSIRLFEIYILTFVYAISIWSIVGLGILIDKIRR